MENPTPTSSASLTPKPNLRPLIIIFAGLIIAGVYAFSQSSGSSVEAAMKTPAPVSEGAKQTASTQADFILKQFGGATANAEHRALVERVGAAIATKSEAKDSGKKFRFTVLAEPDVINSFALPTGEVYVTTALVNRMRTEGELAAALAGATAHALAGHRMQPEAPAAVGTPEASVLQFSVEDETAADAKALKIMADAGYSPESMLSMFKLLTEAYNAGANVQFFATHPSADWRLSTIEKGIKSLYPEGVPAVLSK